MQFLSFTIAPSSMDGLATMSKYFFSGGLCTAVVMTLIYLWYTIGSARLARRLALAEQKSSTVASTQKAASHAKLGDGEGSVATLTRSDIVLHEQPDGEKPIPLNLSLLAIGRMGTTVGWLTVLLLGLSQVLRAIVIQHAPWSNL